MVRESGNLRQVGDAQYLACARQLLEPPADRFGDTASYAAIDLIENQSALCPALAVAGARPSRSNRGFQRQRDARKLTARSDFIERAQLLAYVGGDEKLYSVGASFRPVCRPNLDPENGALERQ
jgi:hypothetical protein